MRVGDVLQLQRRPVSIDPTIDYVSIGVRSFGKGIFHYPPTQGSALSKLRFFEIHPDELIVSNIKAWEGAIAVSSIAETGCIGSNRFLSYKPIGDEIDVRYACYFFLSEAGLRLIQGASPGSADRNRTLAIDRFENIVIPLPDIDAQRRIAARLDRLLSHVDQLASAQNHDQHAQTLALYPALADGVLASVPTDLVPLGDVVRLVSETMAPGDAPGAAAAFVGLQHIESHTGRRLGSAPIGGEKGTKRRFAPNDIVYGNLRPYLNKVWVADLHGICSVDQRVLRQKGEVNVHLLAHAMRARSFVDRVLERVPNQQLPRIRSTELLTLPVAIVSEPEQQRTLRALEARLQQVLHLSDLKNHQLRWVAAARESILNHAFVTNP